MEDIEDERLKVVLVCVSPKENKKQKNAKTLLGKENDFELVDMSVSLPTVNVKCVMLDACKGV